MFLDCPEDWRNIEAEMEHEIEKKCKQNLIVHTEQTLSD